MKITGTAGGNLRGTHGSSHRRRLDAVPPTLPAFSLGDGQEVRSLVMNAGFREVNVRTDFKLSRWQSAEHFVRSMVGGAPTMGVLAEQGAGVLDSIVVEVADSTRGYMDDAGWATPQATNIITAMA